MTPRFLHPDFREFLAFLNEASVEYLVIGGVAVIAHGHVRATKDIDVWVRPEPSNADRILGVIRRFFGSDQGINADTFLKPENIFFMGKEPYRIDVMNDIPGVDFETCYAKCLNIDLGGVTVPVIDLWSLIQNKRASGRPQDLADADKLESLHQDSSDE